MKHLNFNIINHSAVIRRTLASIFAVSLTLSLFNVKAATLDKDGYYKLTEAGVTYDLYVPQHIKGWKLGEVTQASSTVTAEYILQASGTKQKLIAVFFPGRSQVRKLKSLLSPSPRSKNIRYRDGGHWSEGRILLDIGGKKTDAHAVSGLLLTETCCINFGGRVLGKTQDDVFDKMHLFASSILKSVHCKAIKASKK